MFVFYIIYIYIWNKNYYNKIITKLGMVLKKVILITPLFKYDKIYIFEFSYSDNY